METICFKDQHFRISDNTEYAFRKDYHSSEEGFEIPTLKASDYGRRNFINLLKTLNEIVSAVEENYNACENNNIGEIAGFEYVDRFETIADRV